MAIAFDAATYQENYSAGTSATKAFTTSGSDRFLVVSCHSSTSSTPASAVTYNGVSMTQIGSTITISPGVAWLSLWYLINPASGSNNVVATKSAGENLSLAIASYTGVKQSGQPDASGSTTGSSTSPSRSITSIADNCWAIMAIAGDGTGGTLSSSTGWTKRDSAFTRGSIGDNNAAKTPAGSISQTGTLSTSQAWGVIQITIAPAVASGPASVKTVNGLAIASVKTKNDLAIASVKTINGLA